MNLEGNIAMAIQFANKNGEEVTLFNVGPFFCDAAKPRLIETDDAYIMFGYCYSDDNVGDFLNGCFQYHYNGTSKDVSPDYEINNDDEGRFLIYNNSGRPLMGNYNVEDAKGTNWFNLSRLYEDVGYVFEIDGEGIVDEEVCYLLKCEKQEDMILDDDDDAPRFTKTKTLKYNYSNEELCTILGMMDRNEFDSLDELIDYINEGVVDTAYDERKIERLWKIDCDKMPISKFAEENFIHSPKWSYRFMRAYDRGNKLTDEDQDNAEGVWFLDSYTIEHLAKTESDPDEAASKMFRKDLAACNGDNILLEVEAWRYYKGKKEDGPDFGGFYSPLVYDYWDSEGEAEKGMDSAIEDECGADGYTQLEYDVKMTREYPNY